MQPVAFQLPIDIMNRGLQRVGAKRIVSVTEDSKNCDEVTFCYDKLRVAELRRNVWRFSIRTACLRPLGPTTLFLVPPLWSATANYIPGSLVKLNNGKIYFGQIDNINKSPDENPTEWSQYFGPQTVSLYDTAASGTNPTLHYYAGELVYTPAQNGTVKIYMVLNPSGDVPTTVPAWDATVTYNKGDTVTQTAVVYQSTVDLNLNNTPTGAAPWLVIAGTQPDRRMGQNWLRVNCTAVSKPVIYPIGSGPGYQSTTRNVFLLPYGYLRKAPQDPKGGMNSFLGGPGGNWEDDWDFQDQYITSDCDPVLVLRFAADVADVTRMDSMFCEALACRVAFEVCEPLTQSGTKLGNIGQSYTMFMGDARAVNGIETGPTEPPEDDFITVRR